MILSSYFRNTLLPLSTDFWNTYKSKWEENTAWLQNAQPEEVNGNKKSQHHALWWSPQTGVLWWQLKVSYMPLCCSAEWARDSCTNSAQLVKVRQWKGRTLTICHQNNGRRISLSPPGMTVRYTHSISGEIMPGPFFFLYSREERGNLSRQSKCKN